MYYLIKTTECCDLSKHGIERNIVYKSKSLVALQQRLCDICNEAKNDEEISYINGVEKKEFILLNNMMALSLKDAWGSGFIRETYFILNDEGVEEISGF